jgi:hypothetical protein
MRVRGFLSVGAVSFLLSAPVAEACRRPDPPTCRAPKCHDGPTASHDSSVARAWGDLLYGALRDEKVNPPLASRLIGLFGVTLYETVVPGMPCHRSLRGQLNDLCRLPTLDCNRKKVNWSLAANAALARLLRGLLPTATPATLGAIDALEARIASEQEDGCVPAKWKGCSEEHGRAIADAVLAWAAGDGLADVLAGTFTPPVGPELWVPTPPANVANPLLPHWGEMRPFALLSGAECPPPGPPAFSTDPDSAFFGFAKEVYDTVNGLSAEQLAIAKFWADAGPGTGTPPGHWVRILNQVAEAEDLSLATTAEAYARLGIAVNDAFIQCWYVKYQYNLLRPVTYIRAYVDPAWLPPIATPPFPSYTSGHSTQSGASAYVLADLLGEIPFEDHTHDANGLPARSFSGFSEASEEAAISRLYGGIHYAFDNQDGLDAGRCIGRKILRRVEFERRRCRCR